MEADPLTLTAIALAMLAIGWMGGFYHGRGGKASFSDLVRLLDHFWDDPHIRKRFMVLVSKDGTGRFERLRKLLDAIWAAGPKVRTEVERWWDEDEEEEDG